MNQQWKDNIVYFPYQVWLMCFPRNLSTFLTCIECTWWNSKQWSNVLSTDKYLSLFLVTNFYCCIDKLFTEMRYIVYHYKIVKLSGKKKYPCYSNYKRSFYQSISPSMRLTFRRYSQIQRKNIEPSFQPHMEVKLCIVKLHFVSKDHECQSLYSFYTNYQFSLPGQSLLV